MKISDKQLRLLQTQVLHLHRSIAAYKQLMNKHLNVIKFTNDESFIDIYCELQSQEKELTLILSEVSKQQDFRYVEEIDSPKNNYDIIIKKPNI